MKQLKAIALCMICLAVSFSAMAYNQRITLSVKGEPIHKVLEQIEKQSGYKFFYSDKTVDVQRMVSVEAVNRDVVAVVDEIFADQNIKCSIMENNIVLSQGAVPARKAINSPPPRRCREIYR